MARNIQISVLSGQDIYIKDSGLDLTGGFNLKKESVIAGLRKAVRKRDLRSHYCVVHSRHGIGSG